jgi:hypothetical protein
LAARAILLERTYLNERDYSGMVKLQRADAGSVSEFKAALQDSFRIAAEADSGEPLEEPIPSDADIEQAIAATGAATYWIVADDQRVGGAVVVIDEISNQNALSFFFISTSRQSRGLGLQAWKAIEKAYPNTKSWETVTPYFEKRNIHFYVNRCGFKIVEFFNKFNPDPNQIPPPADQQGDVDDMFRFVKSMDAESA